MLKVPRFIVQDQIFNFASTEVTEPNLILVHGFENEELEKDLLKKICQSINILSYDIKTLESGSIRASAEEIISLNDLAGGNHNFIFEFDPKCVTTSLDSSNGVTHLKTFPLNQLLTNKDQKLNLWTVLKTLKN